MFVVQKTSDVLENILCRAQKNVEVSSVTEYSDKLKFHIRTL